MKYRAFFLIMFLLNFLTYEGRSTVVYLQSSKAKDLKMSKSKKTSIVKKCPSSSGKTSTQVRKEPSAYNGGS